MSGIFFNEENTLSSFTQANKAKGFRTTFKDNYESAKADFYARYRSDSKVLGFGEVFTEEFNKHKHLLSDDFPNPLYLNHPDVEGMAEIEDHVKQFNDNLVLNGEIEDLEKGYLSSYQAHIDWYFDQVDKMKKSDPIKYKDLKTRDEIDQEVIDRARDAWSHNNQVSANAEPGLFGWNWGQIAAGARAGITDPLVLATIPLGVATGGWSLSGTVGMQFVKTFAVEAVLGMASETAIQFGVYDYNNSELGIEYTKKEALTTIFTVGAASGVLSTVLLGLFKTGAIPFAKYQEYKISKDPEAWLEKNLTSIINDATKNRPEVKELIMDALSEMPRDDLIKFVQGLPNNMKTKDLYRFLDMEDNKKININSNPFKKNTQNDLDYQKSLDEAKENLLNDSIPTEEKPIIQLDEGVKEYADGFTTFKIDELETDANIFQYKEGGDEFGVTDRLKDVTEWNPHASNAIIVYEFADGRKVIADGHQRLGLAKRILAQNDGQKPQLAGMLYREVDGYSPDQIKIWAAIKNIQEGSGTSIDAAKILRISKETFDDFKGSLPKRSNLVREAMAMYDLADDAFDLVVRGQFPPAHAAMVAGLVKDKSMHKTILQLLKQTNPSNLAKARTIILQAMDSGTQKIEQTDLLGTEFITKSLFTNKADILDAVIKGLRADKNLFKRLNLQKNKINSSGKNVLDDTYNQNRELINEKILQFIENQATRKGNQLADDLNIAAKLHADGKESQAIKQFGEAVERANARGDFDGYDVGGSGSAERSPIQDNRILEEEDLSTANPQDNFSDPAGTGQKEQGDFLQNQLEEILDIPLRPERGEFSVDEVLQNSSPIDRKVIRPILKKIDPKDLEDALTTINKARAKSKLPPFKNLDDAIDQYEADQIAFNKLDTTESIMNTPQRESLRLNITNILQKHHGHTTAKDKLFKGQPKAEKKVVFVMGKPGSGKSTIEAVPLIKKLKAVLIDSDEAKKLFPEFDNGKGAGVIHVESTEVAAELILRATDNGHNMVIPVVGSSFESLSGKMALLKERGYKVYLHNVDIPGDESYRRSFVRYLNTGRLINHAYLIDVGDKPNLVYKQIKESKLADGYKKTDNFVKKGQQPILIENEGGISLREKSIDANEKKVQETGSRKIKFSKEDKEFLEEIKIAEFAEEYSKVEYALAYFYDYTPPGFNKNDFINFVNDAYDGWVSGVGKAIHHFAEDLETPFEIVNIVLPALKREIDFDPVKDTLTRMNLKLKKDGSLPKEESGEVGRAIKRKKFNEEQLKKYLPIIKAVQSDPNAKIQPDIGVETKVPELSSEQKLLDEFKDEEFSISSKMEEDEIMADMITAKSALEDINNDQAIINRLRDCVI
jgi:predicted ABC-type ATPase